MTTDRRFIEESFPVKEVGAASAKEKNIRHGHISTLHIWWARRPLAASRATAYAALTPAPKDAEEWAKKRDFIIQLSQWENTNNQILLERARREILEANGGVPPKVLDPFSGGGSYPLEALRLGCESYANDYNPVAVLIEKATLEYPQKFGRPFENMPEWAKNPEAGKQGNKKTKNKSEASQASLFDTSEIENQQLETINPLRNAVRYWGKWVLDEAQKELTEFYPPDPDGSVPVGYIWARTIPCQNPACGHEIPLARQFWLAKTPKKKVAYRPIINDGGELDFQIIGNGYADWPEDFDPEKATIARAVVTCPTCGSVIDADDNRRLFQEKKSGQRMVVVVLSANRGGGKRYRVATKNDEIAYYKAENALVTKRQDLISEWGIDPIPDEILPLMSGTFNVPIYGMNTWGSLFNQRQLLTLITFVQKIRSAIHSLSQNANAEFVEAVSTYLAIALDRIAIYQTTLGYWHNTRELINPGMGRQAISMTWDYVEGNLFGGNANWDSALEWIERVIDHCSVSKSPNTKPCTLSQASATKLPFVDNFFDAVFTDPPYYNSVPYADLSDFFYVWLKRTLGFLLSDLFSTPLTPKDKEITEMAGWDPVRYPHKDKAFFENNLKNAFQEIFRILRPEGVSTIVYAHKSTEGWETVINALLDSGLVVTGAWPVNTEMEGRLRASDSAALASSIYIVARKMPRQPTGFYNDVRNELRLHMDAKLHRLWEEGIGGGDFFIAAIGSAIEVFGKYEKVMDYEGNIVRADRLLEEVRAIATNYAVRQILHTQGDSDISPLARFYVLWRWNYGEATLPFDEANKLAHSCGLDLSLAFGKNGCIKKEKDLARLLGPQNRKLDDLDDPRDLIDVLHKALLLWEKGQRGELVKTLAEGGHGRSETFYRVAQAISETLPLESKEKKLLDGFLAGRERIQDEVEKSGEQGRLL